MPIQQMFLGIPTPSSGSGIDIESNGLIAYWNAISANVQNQGSAPIINCSVSSNPLYSNTTSMTWEASNGGRVNVPSGGDNFFEWANRFTFNGGTAWTYFWCGIKLVSSNNWWMMATNNDGDNFIGVYADYLHRLDSNNNIKGDLSLSNISYATNTIHCFYVTMKADGNMTWFHNGSTLGSVTFGDGTNVWAADSAVFKFIDRYQGTSLHSEGRFHFSGFYDRDLSSSEVSSNWSAHQARLGI